jgi:hypothetical protein
MRKLQQRRETKKKDNKKRSWSGFGKKQKINKM